MITELALGKILPWMIWQLLSEAVADAGSADPRNDEHLNAVWRKILGMFTNILYTKKLNQHFRGRVIIPGNNLRTLFSITRGSVLRRSLCRRNAIKS
jgi:hypothetical protein